MSDFIGYKSFVKKMIRINKIQMYILAITVISFLAYIFSYYDGNLFGISRYLAFTFVVTLVIDILLLIMAIPLQKYLKKNINFENVLISLLKNLSSIKKYEDYKFKIDLFYVLDELKISNYSGKNIHKKMLFSKSGFRNLSGNLVNIRNKSINNMENFLKNDLIFLTKQQRKDFIEKLIISIENSDWFPIIEFIELRRNTYKTKDKFKKISPTIFSKIYNISDKSIVYLNARFHALVLIIFFALILFLIISGQIELLIQLIHNIL